ncbi:MAG: MGMT family protein, partial [Rhodocyclaceae bacterium]|nr:MGMT family protein [Rhodocyclaceae bacterium]
RMALSRAHARAVARACAANPLPLLIPCHRILAAGQKLGGYNGGIARKRALLVLEGHDRAKDG